MIMANFKVLFQDLAENYESRIDAEYYDSVGKLVTIKIKGIDDGTKDVDVKLSFDISTAIKFAKTLRTEINKAKELYYEG